MGIQSHVHSISGVVVGVLRCVVSVYVLCDIRTLNPGIGSRICFLLVLC